MNIWLKVGLRDYTLISPEDYNVLKDKTLVINKATDKYKRVYVCIGKSQVLLHRYILNFPKLDIDHIDRNPLNNTRENLRLCSKQENANNKWVVNNRRRSVLKGIVFCKNNIYWEYRDKVNNKRGRFGPYFSEKFAYSDYCDFKKRQIGKFFYYKPIDTFPLEFVVPKRQYHPIETKQDMLAYPLTLKKVLNTGSILK